MSLNFVQLNHPLHGRKVALVEEPNLRLLHRITTTYDLFYNIIHSNQTVSESIENLISNHLLDYTPIHEGNSNWSLLPCIDHPDPAHCHITGTGLTHINSALNRQSMHKDQDEVSDSIKMYQWGIYDGKPQQESIGVQPEWFYKGDGSILKGHLQDLHIPNFADDGGEEAELTGIYIIDQYGNPHRMGFTIGNEFSDHVMEEKNYLYLAPSKLRECSIGPELVIDANIESIDIQLKLIRENNELWQAKTQTGEKHMSHSVQNLEHHHFKNALHRQKGHLHLHFLGANTFSFGSSPSFQKNDCISMEFSGFGRPLKNTISQNTEQAHLFKIPSLQ